MTFWCGSGSESGSFYFFSLVEVNQAILSWSIFIIDLQEANKN